MKQEDLKLKMADGLTIRGVFNHANDDQPAPVVIFVHGFGSNRRGEKAVALEAECARRSWAFAAFDFRGHGDSDGVMLELRGSRLLEELDAIVTAVANRASGPVFLFGSSMGGWASAWFAAHNPGRVNSCALVAPALRFLEFIRLSDEEREEWRRAGRRRARNEFVDVEIEYEITAEADEFRFETLATRFCTPALIFHGMNDDVVPYTISADFIKRAAARDVELMIFKRGDLRLNREREKLARMACDFFAARMDG